MAEHSTPDSAKRDALEGPNRNRNAETDSGKKERRGKAKWILLGILIIACPLVIYLWSYLAVREKTDNAQIDGHINPVAARLGGTVMTVHVKDNEHVEAGSLLVEIDPRDYRVALERARAELDAAEASARAAGMAVPVTSITASSQLSGAKALLKSAEARVVVASREVESARSRSGPLEARLRETEVILQRSLQDLERMKQLIAKDRISRQQYDAAVAVADAAKASRDAASAALEESKKGVETAEARLAQAHAGVAEAQSSIEATRAAPEQIAMAKSQAATAQALVMQARAALERAQLDLEYTEIKAPVSGFVSMKNVEIGQVVQRDQPLMAIVPLDDIWVMANFKESQLMNIRVGQPATISVDAYDGTTYHGRVESIAAATGARFSLLPPENATGNYVKVVQRIPVKIVLDQGQDPDHLLRPGMSVVPTVLTK